MSENRVDTLVDTDPVTETADQAPDMSSQPLGVFLSADHFQTGWVKDAACHNMNQDLFYSELKGRERIRVESIAKFVCSTCSVRQSYLAVEIVYDMQPPKLRRFGIRGGLTPRERNAFLRIAATEGGMHKATAFVNTLWGNASRARPLWAEATKKGFLYSTDTRASAQEVAAG